MEEAICEHLKLDSFTSFQSDFGGNVRRRRKIDGSNKENHGYCIAVGLRTETVRLFVQMKRMDNISLFRRN
ncbi:hypothetical protein ACET3Z_013391 [Daucus carota]